MIDACLARLLLFFVFCFLEGGRKENTRRKERKKERQVEFQAMFLAIFPRRKRPLQPQSQAQPHSQAFGSSRDESSGSSLPDRSLALSSKTTTAFDSGPVEDPRRRTGKEPPSDANDTYHSTGRKKPRRWDKMDDAAEEKQGKEEAAAAAAAAEEEEEDDDDEEQEDRDYDDDQKSQKAKKKVSRRMARLIVYETGGGGGGGYIIHVCVCV